MMTCFTPSPTRSDHVHFIDGAQGGYAAAATALKAALRLRAPSADEPGVVADFASAAAPAVATCSSCEDSAPETPMAPMILPSTTTSTPP